MAAMSIAVSPESLLVLWASFGGKDDTPGGFANSWRGPARSLERGGPGLRRRVLKRKTQCQSLGRVKTAINAIVSGWNR